METENRVIFVLPDEIEESCVNGLLHDDILSAVWDAADKQTDSPGNMEIDLLSANSHDENELSVVLNTDLMPEMLTDDLDFDSTVNFLTIESPNELSSEDSMLPSSCPLGSGTETSIPPKKKRGRKPKSERGLIIPRPRKPKKVRVYEIDQPFEDKDLERKRLSALNAKKHRDQQKNQMKSLEHDIEAVKIERDSLKREEESLRRRVASQLQQVEFYKKHLQALANSSVQILQATP